MANEAHERCATNENPAVGMQYKTSSCCMCASKVAWRDLLTPWTTSHALANPQQMDVFHFSYTTIKIYSTDKINARKAGRTIPRRTMYPKSILISHVFHAGKPPMAPPKVYPGPPDAFLKEISHGGIRSTIHLPNDPNSSTFLFLNDHLILSKSIFLVNSYSRETSRPKSLDLAQSFITSSRFRATIPPD